MVMDMHPLLAAIDKAKESQPQSPRYYLGGSELGDECHRRLWYEFHRFKRRYFPARVQRIFEAGHAFEDRIVADLRSHKGTVVLDRDPETGRQYAHELHGGHVRSHFDGLIKSPLMSSPDEWYLLEIKSYNKDRFRNLVRSGVAVSDPKYFSQMQFYMGSDEAKARGIRAAYFVAECKDNGERYGKEVPFDLMHQLLLEKAAQVILEAQEPPARCAQSPDWFACKFCSHKGHCWGNDPLEIHDCRQCVWARPSVTLGKWVCTNEASPHYRQTNTSICGAFEGFPGHTWERNSGGSPEPEPEA